MWRFVPKVGASASQIVKSGPGGAADSNFLRLLAQSPAALNAYAQAKDALAKGQLSPPQREGIALAVAAINGSNYCLASHRLAGKQAGLSDAEINLARKASAPEAKSEAMLRFVQAVVLQRGEISDQDFTAVRRGGFSEAEIIEVLANIWLNIFTNYFNLLAQTELDHPLPPPDPQARPPEPVETKRTR